MIKYIYITVCLLFAGILSGYAQPGYQGKKLSLQANMLLFPAKTNAAYSKAPDYTSLNITKEASIDYVLGRRNTIGITYKNLRTSTLRGYESDAQVIPSGKVYSNAIGLHYRVFKRKAGNLAPLGKYTQYGLNVMFNRTEDSKNPSSNVSFKTYALTMGKGRSKILYNRIILNYGLEFSHMFTGFNKEGLKGATYYYKDDAQTMAQYRLWRHSLLNVKMGIGFLAI